MLCCNEAFKLPAARHVNSFNQLALFQHSDTS